MSEIEGCARNLDGTLKAANEIQWVHSPTQEHIELPGAQLDCNGVGVQVLPVVPQPSAVVSKQPPSQSAIAKNPKKRKQGQPGETRVKKTANDRLGIQRILANGSMQSGVFFARHSQCGAHSDDRHTSR